MNAMFCFIASLVMVWTSTQVGTDLEEAVAFISAAIYLSAGFICATVSNSGRRL